MEATAFEREHRLAVLPDRGADPRGEALPHRQISPKRALGLVLPGQLLIDALLVTGGFLGAVHLSFRTSLDLHSVASALTPPLLALYLVLACGFLLLGGMYGLYSRRLLRHPRRAAAGVARAVLWSGAAAVTFDFLLALEPPAAMRELLVVHALLLAAAALTIRPLAFRLLLRLAEVGPVPPRRVLIVGRSPDARRVAGSLEEDDPGSRVIVGLVAADPLARGSGFRWPRFQAQTTEQIARLAQALAADEVVLATRNIDRGAAVELASELASDGCRVMVVPHLTRLYADGAPVRREGGVPLLDLGRATGSALEARVKRAMDFLLAGLSLVIATPLMLFVALLVKVSSPGPVLYAQERVGRGGKHFRMYKFRSMTASNDDSHHREYVASLMFQGDAAGFDASGRPIYKLLDDPRITFIGKFLRRTSLDELPQILNVLRGEMSLVGPRPCLPFEYDLYQPWQKLRLESVPGMTGLWQVSGRSFLSFEEMVLLDLYYASNWSLMLDLKLMWRTVPEVMGARGAR